MIKILEYCGSLLAVIGALLLATNYNPFVGYICFLFSAFLLVAHAIQSKLNGLIFMQTVFIFINLIGVITWHV